MKLGTLEHMLGIIIRNQKVLGIDICGECDTNMPLPEYVISLLLLNPIALISFFSGPTRISWQIYGLSLITFPAQSPQLVNPSIIGFCISVW